MRSRITSPQPPGMHFRSAARLKPSLSPLHHKVRLPRGLKASPTTIDY